MPRIELGRDQYGNIVYYNETLRYGVIIVIAQPRYGKSILVKNLYTQIAEHRNLVIFDYQGEHIDSKYGNWRSKDRIDFLPELKTIENFGFYVSDFDQFADWTSMGFSIKGVPILMKILKEVEVHQNSPTELLKILSYLPTSDKDVIKFNNIWPEIDITEPINYSVKQSLVSTMNAVIATGLIIAVVGTDEHQEKTPGKIHIDDWAKLVIETPHLNINLNLFSSGSVGIARASVGKILEKLLPILSKVKPLIVAEEAAKICPNTGESDNEIITSQMQLRDYVIRHQRTGVKLMFITQDPNLLDQDTLGAGMTWIFGIHKPNATTKSILDTYNLNYEKDIVSKLRHDNDKDLRDFAIMDVGTGGKFQIFTPLDSATRIPYKYNLRSTFLQENPRKERKIKLRDLMFT